MRVMTWNIHSMVDGHTAHQLREVAALVKETRPDVVALQEVNQEIGAPLAGEALLAACGAADVPSKVPLREGNFALRLCGLLREGDGAWRFAWTAAHRGYERLEEGVALLTRQGIEDVLALPLTEDTPIPRQAAQPGQGMGDWRRRVALLVRTGGVWVGSVHCGWWRDELAPFAAQWARLEAGLPGAGPLLLLGDFNNPDAVRGEGYDLLRDRGWQDAWACAGERDEGWTARAGIDGWRGTALTRMRLDLVLGRPGLTCSRCVTLRRDDLSDHAGVLADVTFGA